MSWSAAAAVAGALLATWAVLVAVLWWAARREGEGLRAALRLLPDVVVLVRRLAGDHDLPRSVRWRVAALLAYLLLPVDLVPDVVPVVGWADDVVVAVWVLRSVVRRAGPEVVERHWPGTPAGLVVVRRVCGWGSGSPLV